MQKIKRVWCKVFGHSYYLDDDAPTQDGLELKCERCNEVLHIGRIFW
jgi:hypothetical protein